MKDLKLLLVRHNRQSPAPRIIPSSISFHELTILLKGTLEYYVNGEPILLRSGDMVYIPKGTLRARREETEVGDYISFNFQSEEPWELPHHIQGALANEIRLQVALCDELMQKYSPDHEDKITHVLACLLLTLQSHLKAKSLHPLVAQILRYLHENMAQRITLSDIGQHTFFSPVYCDTVFKQEMGRSIIDYLLEQRMEEAKKLLLEGSVSLRKIAESVGFPDYNYFARTFKKRTGYTPVQYQRIVSRSSKSPSDG